MVRIIISLSAKNKTWLDKVARNENISMTEVVRRAISAYKKNHLPPHRSPLLENLLRKTSGIWKKEDSLNFLKKLREEWEKD